MNVCKNLCYVWDFWSDITISVWYCLPCVIPLKNKTKQNKTKRPQKSPPKKQTKSKKIQKGNPVKFLVSMIHWAIQLVTFKGVRATSAHLKFCWLNWMYVFFSELPKRMYDYANNSSRNAPSRSKLPWLIALSSMWTEVLPPKPVR